MMTDFDEIVDIVVTTAKSIINPMFGQVRGELKNDGSIVTEVDLKMHRTLQKKLFEVRPKIEFLSEELPDDERKSLMQENNQALWILDPLDGTTNFSAGIPFFSVSLALQVQNKIEFGIVYDPVRNECFTAHINGGAFLNGEPIKNNHAPSLLSQSVAVIDLKRISTPLGVRIMSDPPFRSQRSFGSVALDWCWVAMGRGHVYLHGEQKIWDFAAGQLILQQSGGKSSSLEGDPVYNSNLQPSSAVAATTPVLHKQWCDWLKAH